MSPALQTAEGVTFGAGKLAISATASGGGGSAVASGTILASKITEETGGRNHKPGDAQVRTENHGGTTDGSLAKQESGIEITLKRPPGVTDAQWQAKLDALNKAAAEGRAKVVYKPARSGAAQRQARTEGRIEVGDDADHGLDLQFGGEDIVDEIISTNPSVNRSVGGQGRQRLQYPEGTAIRLFKETKE
jgi:hypothetical protein